MIEEGSGDEFSEIDRSPNYDSSKKMLNKLKSSASMAITVTTGKKIEANRKPNSSNVIPGFGYAVMDIFENEFVDMASIVKVKDQIEEAGEAADNLPGYGCDAINMAWSMICHAIDLISDDHDHDRGGGGT